MVSMLMGLAGFHNRENGFCPKEQGQLCARFRSHFAHFAHFQATSSSNEQDICHKLPGALIKGADRSLDRADLPLLEKGLTALAADPGRDVIEGQVVSVPVNVERRRRALHCPATVNAVHDVSSFGGSDQRLCERALCGRKALLNHSTKARAPGLSWRNMGQRTSISCSTAIPICSPRRGTA